MDSKALKPCRICKREFDHEDLYNGLCERCSKEQYTKWLGIEFRLQYFAEWIDYSCGVEVGTLTKAEEEQLIKDFCFEDMDRWGEFLARQTKGAARNTSKQHGKWEE